MACTVLPGKRQHSLKTGKSATSSALVVLPTTPQASALPSNKKAIWANMASTGVRVGMRLYV
eukprot:CAMPEP_0177360946 /NCGR_PEP_ID=MMETSP0368-20130122/36924_1 /TAXON_ID=447022 ORGANISM="Scrippsiella hangoei-like, Strain SHHI-4" /NCGR_SAMPLE_ID=MMETSP0368 /ASSEMBLY_ACC=CAM_ASM_000363 /LENGTH=61 /DNA_ID=CAMNT_0018823567 /DNA_START=110 /DNA_END=292 /DNA_ORIENTATION=-